MFITAIAWYYYSRDTSLALIFFMLITLEAGYFPFGDSAFSVRGHGLSQRLADWPSVFRRGFEMNQCVRAGRGKLIEVMDYMKIGVT